MGCAGDTWCLSLPSRDHGTDQPMASSVSMPPAQCTAQGPERASMESALCWVHRHGQNKRSMATVWKGHGMSPGGRQLIANWEPPGQRQRGLLEIPNQETWHKLSDLLWQSRSSHPESTTGQRGINDIETDHSCPAQGPRVSSSHTPRLCPHSPGMGPEPSSPGRSCSSSPPRASRRSPDWEVTLCGKKNPSQTRTGTADAHGHGTSLALGCGSPGAVLAPPE